MDRTKGRVDAARSPAPEGWRQQRQGGGAPTGSGRVGGEDLVLAKPLLTTGEAARALSISVQSVRNWVSAGRLSAVRQGTRTMLPRDVVLAEIGRSFIKAGHGGDAGPVPIRDLPRERRIYGWMARANAEGVHFPLEEYNARIPQDFVQEVLDQAASDLILTAAWSEHFQAATEDNVLALFSGAD